MIVLSKKRRELWGKGKGELILMKIDAVAERVVLPQVSAGIQTKII